MPFHLGKKPAREGAVSFRFVSYFDAPNLPVPPIAFGHGDGLAFSDLGNTNFGDCVWAGAAHETQVWAGEGGLSASFTTDNVLADYAAVTGFIPADPATDQGTDMAAAASYRRNTGIVDASGTRHKIDSYLALENGNCEQLALATYLLGAAGVGIQFPATAMDQFIAGQSWDVVDGPADIQGGHYVPCIGRAPNGNFIVVSWGKRQEMTPAFYQRFCDEALGYVSIEALKDNLSPEGFRVDELRADLATLTSAKEIPMVDNVPVQGKAIDPDEVAAAEAALQNLVDTKVGIFYRHFFTAQLVEEAATAVVVAIESYRSGKTV